LLVPLLLAVTLALILDPSSTYSGELIFDLQNKRITPKVTTRVGRGYGDDLPQDDRAKKRKAADELNQLSGGEKSFGTACFVMSLWKCVVEAPFRLMDEVSKFGRSILLAKVSILVRYFHGQQQSPTNHGDA